MTPNHQPPLLELRAVSKSFAREGGKALEVLHGVNLTLRSGEIVGLLGRSGSGKSTLLRVMAGLLAPTGGQALFLGQPISGPPQGVAMVFQSFALFPWLNVLQNVQLGLEALGLTEAESRKRAVEAIDLIGLDGFEHAYPRELSGGMQQRVGLARALVVHPKVLLMDEPFSALDVLTAETLRTDLLALWTRAELPIGAIVLVTHSIEEAVLMCDRVLVMGSQPGRVVADVPVALERPRDRKAPSFALLVDHLFGQLTDAGAAAPPTALPAGVPPRTVPVGELPPEAPLTAVPPAHLGGLVELVAAPPYRGQADLPALVGDLRQGIGDLFEVAETLQLLGFAELSAGDIRLTDAGVGFAAASGDARKHLFGQRLLERVGLIGHIVAGIRAQPDEELPLERVRHMLLPHMPAATVEETLHAAVLWGRYAELFSYDDRDGYLSFENL